MALLRTLTCAALVAGCLMVLLERLRNDKQTSAGSYFDWALVLLLLLVALTGFCAELLHYLRLEPHRHIVYFVHLVFALSVLMYLPYSKLAHVVYRATALVFAEHTGRDLGAKSSAAAPGRVGVQEGNDDVGEATAKH